MQSAAPAREETGPSISPDASSMDARHAPSPALPKSAEASSAGAVDPLAAEAAARIADVINDFRRKLDQRDGAWPLVKGELELAFDPSDPATTFKLTVTPHPDGNDHPIAVHATLNEPADVTPIDATTAPAPPFFNPTRRASDAALERDIVSPQKRTLDHAHDESNKRTRTSDKEGADHTMPLITREDLVDLLVRLRQDVQDDTVETVNHVQRLLRRFKEEWHEQTKRDIEHSQTSQPLAPSRNSISAAGAGAGPDGAFPSSDLDHDDASASVAELVRRQAALISRQVRWVEDCRRVASDAHTKREENWRTSSAGFHDQQRQDRENFQTQMVRESAMHTQTLNQILNEVKTIGLYAQNMKWETPSYLNHTPSTMPQFPTPPAFPTQQATPAFPTQRAHTPSSNSKQSAQQKHFTWKTGRGPGTHNG